MMGVHDLIADLVHRRLTVDLKVLNELFVYFQHCVADDVPLLRCHGRNPARAVLVSGLQITVHEVDFL
jgi:hypothetical protein